MVFISLQKLTKGVNMANFEELEKDFWCIDCLIRMLKEILFTKTLELHEGDIMTISEILVEKSENLSKKVTKFRKTL